MAILTSSQVKLYGQVVADLVRHEGYKKYAYADPLSELYRKVAPSEWGEKPARELLPQGTDWRKGSPWTVGIGYTTGVTVDSVMERIKAERITEGVVADLDRQLLNVLPWLSNATFAVRTVLINMAYNMGVAGLLQFKNTLYYIKEGNYVQAARNMEQSLWYRQTKSRAKELVERMETQTIPQEYLK